MCDVPSIAISCSESIKCFPGTVSKFFLKLLVTIPLLLLLLLLLLHSLQVIVRAKLIPEPIRMKLLACSWLNGVRKIAVLH